MWKLGVLLLTLVGVAGCEKEEGCATDKDCKADRVCDARLRLCVDPGPGGSFLDGGVDDGPGVQRDGASSMPDCTDVGPMPMGYQFATSVIKLPTSATNFSTDIDGDGRADNQLKAIIGAIASANFDLQGPLDAAVKAGELVLLADVRATNLVNGCAEITLSTARPAVMPPRYDGTDTFAIDFTQPQAVLRGRLVDGQLSTKSPKDLRGLEVQKLLVPLPFVTSLVPMTLYGVHFQGALGIQGLTGGQLHGVIRKTEIDTQIIPAVAQLLTNQIRKDPMGSTTETIIRLFEDEAGNPASKAKCTNTPEKCCKTPANRTKTCEIVAEEVRTNALIGNVLAADVQVFQGDIWSPVPKGTSKDAMSLGLGLSGPKATWARN